MAPKPLYSFFYIWYMNKLIIGAAVLYFLSRGGDLFASSVKKEITVGTPKVRFKGITWSGVKILLTIPITNNNPVTFPVSAIQGDIFYKGVLAGSFNSAKSFNLTPNETVNTETLVTLSIPNAVEAITNAIEKGIDLNLLIKGNLISMGVNFPFTYTLRP